VRERFEIGIGIGKLALRLAGLEACRPDVIEKDVKHGEETHAVQRRQLRSGDRVLVVLVEHSASGDIIYTRKVSNQLQGWRAYADSSARHSPMNGIRGASYDGGSRKNPGKE